MAKISASSASYDDPGLAVVEVSTRELIEAAEEGAAHAAADALVVGGGVDVDLSVARLRHAARVPSSKLSVK